MARTKTRNPKEWTVEDMKILLRHSDVALEKSILQIFARQTADEQSSETTRHHNKVGFNGVDATFLSSLAKQLQNGKHLSDRQKHYARNKMTKYSKQLVSCMTGEKSDKVMEFISNHKEK